MDYRSNINTISSITTTPVRTDRADDEIEVPLKSSPLTATFETQYDAMVSCMESITLEDNQRPDPVEAILVPLFAALTIGRNGRRFCAIVEVTDPYKGKANLILAVDTTEGQEQRALDTFKPFLRLPIELRLAIWSLALPPPRVVELDLCRGSYDWFSPTLGSNGANGLIRASFESRELFLKHYSPICKQGRRGTKLAKYIPPENTEIPLMQRRLDLLIAESDCESDHACQKSPITYVNFDQDTIYFVPSSDGLRNNTCKAIQYSIRWMSFASKFRKPPAREMFQHFSHLKIWAIPYSDLLGFAQLLSTPQRYRWRSGGALKYTADQLSMLLPSLRLLIVVVDLELIYDWSTIGMDQEISKKRDSKAVTLTDDLSDVEKSCRERLMADADVKNFPLKIEFRAVKRTKLDD